VKQSNVIKHLHWQTVLTAPFGTKGFFSKAANPALSDSDDHGRTKTPLATIVPGVQRMKPLRGLRNDQPASITQPDRLAIREALIRRMASRNPRLAD
jgi:hypothetical protein